MTRRRLRVPVLLAIVSLIGIVACGDDDDSSPVSVATFEVADNETFKIELATSELLEHAQRLLSGEALAAIPIGTVVRDDPAVNEPWSWHIDPSILEVRRCRDRSLRRPPART